MKEENPDKEFAAKLPEQLKEDIGACFSKVLSDDPSMKIPSTRSFMAHLQIAMVLNGETKYDELIKVHTVNAIDAIKLYTEDNWGAAVEKCYKIQADLGFLVYSGYGTVDGKSFSIPTVAPDKAGGKK